VQRETLSRRSAAHSHVSAGDERTISLRELEGSVSLAQPTDSLGDFQRVAARAGSQPVCPLARARRRGQPVHPATIGRAWRASLAVEEHPSPIAIVATAASLTSRPPPAVRDPARVG
jgi:hypothetical protein